MDRASASGAEGRRFESCRARSNNLFRQASANPWLVRGRCQPDIPELRAGNNDALVDPVDHVGFLLGRRPSPQRRPRARSQARLPAPAAVRLLPSIPRRCRAGFGARPSVRDSASSLTASTACSRASSRICRSILDSVDRHRPVRRAERGDHRADRRIVAQRVASWARIGVSHVSSAEAWPSVPTPRRPRHGACGAGRQRTCRRFEADDRRRIPAARRADRSDRDFRGPPPRVLADGSPRPVAHSSSDTGGSARHGAALHGFPGPRRGGPSRCRAGSSGSSDARLRQPGLGLEIPGADVAEGRGAGTRTPIRRPCQVALRAPSHLAP